MPIYEYLCPKCSYKFGRRLPFSQSGEAVRCPECQAPAEKQFSTFAAMSKGAGGENAPISGSSCSSCSATSCSTCDH